jgi:prepilin-type N-terminal cleavage/methylation domain-containing protein
MFLFSRCQRQSQPQTGFSLLEVVVAILIVTTFIAVAMQGMVVAMLLKSKTLQIAQANRWVQDDLELVRSQLTPSSISVAANRARCYPVSLDVGFADAARDRLAGGNVTGVADYNLANLTKTDRVGKTFQIARTLSIPATVENSYGKVLGIKYTVYPTNGGNLESPLLHVYTEVLSDAALQCQ